jgi:hypothetical protein
MVHLIWRDLTFCQFFLRRDTRKLMPSKPRLDGTESGILERELTEHDVSKDLVVVHLDVADSNTQAQNLLELELDGGANLRALCGEVFSMRHGGREFAGLGETRTEETRNLLDESFRGKESVVFLGKFLDELLVFIKPGDRK